MCTCQFLFLVQEITDLLSDGSFTEEDDAELEQELQQLTVAQVEEALPPVPVHEIPVSDREPVAEETAVRRPKKQAVEAD